MKYFNQKGMFSVIAGLFLLTASIAGIGLLAVGKASQSMALSCEHDLQLRYDMEGAMEDVVVELEEKGLQAETDMPISVKKICKDEYNQRDVHLIVYGKRIEEGILLLSIAENLKGEKQESKSMQGFMEKKEDRYKWAYWIPWTQN